MQSSNFLVMTKLEMRKFLAPAEFFPNFFEVVFHNIQVFIYAQNFYLNLQPNCRLFSKPHTVYETVHVFGDHCSNCVKRSRKIIFVGKLVVNPFFFWFLTQALITLAQYLSHWLLQANQGKLTFANKNLSLKYRAFVTGINWPTKVSF